MERRRFIKGVGLTVGSAALASVPGISLAKAPERKVYRLSLRGEQSCNACKGHTANRYYFNKPAADRDRPHVGCDCAVLGQWIPKQTHDAYFEDGPGKQRKIFDKRWGGG